MKGRKECNGYSEVLFHTEGVLAEILLPFMGGAESHKSNDVYSKLSSCMSFPQMYIIEELEINWFVPSSLCTRPGLLIPKLPSDKGKKRRKSIGKKGDKGRKYLGMVSMYNFNYILSTYTAFSFLKLQLPYYCTDNAFHGRQEQIK